MEKVHFQLESTLPELRDLEEKGLFTRAELRQITLRRTKHESDLVKRAGKPEDYLKYAEYEIGLERLRRIRWKRLSRWHSRLWTGTMARIQHQLNLICSL
jgi:U3 small nucleolar RNA-associated protein 6